MFFWRASLESLAVFPCAMAAAVGLYLAVPLKASKSHFDKLSALLEVYHARRKTQFMTEYSLLFK